MSPPKHSKRTKKKNSTAKRTINPKAKSAPKKPVHKARLQNSKAAPKKRTISAKKVSKALTANNKTEIPSYLRVPGAGIDQPPSAVKPHDLPISSLTWEDFERLCFRLALKEEAIEFCQLYGSPCRGNSDCFFPTGRNEECCEPCRGEKLGDEWRALEKIAPISLLEF